MTDKNKEITIKNNKLQAMQIIDQKWFSEHIYKIRGQKVMLDSDLAKVYGYTTKRLNEQVKRNSEKFPDDFMFLLSRKEVELVKSQIATSPMNNYFSGQDGGRRKQPYAFTESGVYSLMTILKGELAIKQNSDH